jgi:putative transcriptional regulator
MGKVFDSIRQGLDEAIAHAKGKSVAAIVHHPRDVDVAALRKRIGMTQQEFAARFGFSVATLRHWERGDRQPHGPARVLLKVIDKNPQSVIEALAA